jgi:hypothetical protein
VCLQQQERPAIIGHARGSGGNPAGSSGFAADNSSPHVQTVLSPLEYLEEEKERDEGEVAEVEMVLETYFMHLDNTYNKLQTLGEYIDDTEVSGLLDHLSICVNSLFGITFFFSS